MMYRTIDAPSSPRGARWCRDWNLLAWRWALGRSLSGALQIIHRPQAGCVFRGSIMANRWTEVLWDTRTMRACIGIALCSLIILAVTHATIVSQATESSPSRLIAGKSGGAVSTVHPKKPEASSTILFLIWLQKWEAAVGISAAVMGIAIATSQGYCNWRFEEWMRSQSERHDTKNLNDNPSNPGLVGSLISPVSDATDAIGRTLRNVNIVTDISLIQMVTVLRTAVADVPNLRVKAGLSLATKQGTVCGFISGGRVVLWWGGVTKMSPEDCPRVTNLRLVALRDWRFAFPTFVIVLGAAGGYGMRAAIGATIIGGLLTVWRAFRSKPAIMALGESIIASADGEFKSSGAPH